MRLILSRALRLFWPEQAGPVVLALFVVGAIATASSDAPGDPSDIGATKTLVSDPAASSTPQEADAQSDDSEPEATVSTAPRLTAVEIDAAEGYLDYSAFSRSGLIEQLE